MFVNILSNKRNIRILSETGVKTNTYFQCEVCKLRKEGGKRERRYKIAEGMGESVIKINQKGEEKVKGKMRWKDPCVWTLKGVAFQMHHVMHLILTSCPPSCSLKGRCTSFPVAKKVKIAISPACK